MFVPAEATTGLLGPLAEEGERTINGVLVAGGRFDLDEGAQAIDEAGLTLPSFGEKLRDAN